MISSCGVVYAPVRSPRSRGIAATIRKTLRTKGIPLLDPVRTTTWPRRHWPIFCQLAELIAELPADPILMIVGPGGVAAPVRPFIADAVPEKTPYLRRAIRNFPRVVDQVLRRIPGIPLVSLEPRELRELIRRPYQLIVVDISQRVLAAVKKDFPDSQGFHIDVAVAPVPVVVDVIVAYSVLTRTSNGQQAMNHLVASLKPGGLMVVDDRSAQRWLPAPPAFTAVREQIYRKALS